MKRYRPKTNKRALAARPQRLLVQAGADFYRLPELVVRGGLVATDGCRRILDLTAQKICLDMGTAIVTLYGENLRIESFTRRRLLAAGDVRRIDLEKKWGPR